MNLFSHYYIDHEHVSVYYKLGLIMPDVLRHFNKEMRQVVFNGSIVFDNEHLDLVLGVKRHYEVDALFHNLAAFSKFTGILEQQMEQSGLKGNYPRRYFLCHIWLEWLIDRILIQLFPQKCVQFYRDMDAINQQIVTHWFARLDKVAQGGTFLANFNRLKQNQYLFKYPDNEQFVEALLRLYQWVVPQASVDATDYQKFIQITLLTEQTYQDELLSIFSNFSKKP